ncbi:YebC/PmpR family DNA-binding transcriptional regulator [Desulfotomaculum copahuensis]|uniref:Probable transcriptional regulatory protein A6M21_04325 n=1 Tax=Desulfotomaculum copahuensis TaxID=1838280 RepID=A0A1B7LHF8_9FIRM|nr:YebC/PmpR family DNA-binding transcriptional regulator [Desulfotomaculum copahuensis]OAT85732.1 transcriptional regulator [Desulfotomaculum copahuensis]
MSGHSKWSTIKRKKAKVDAQRGKIFTRLAREIIIAARQGGGDPEANARLKAAIQRAREANIPNENIQRAIMRGTGELGGANYEEIIYEGYGPGGVAVMLEIGTDNRNRTAGEIRHLFSKNGGNLGESGCVSWMFDKKGLIVIDRNDTELDEDEVMLLALEAGAEDMKSEEDVFEITTLPEEIEHVRDVLAGKGIPLAMADVTMVPQTTIRLQGREAEQMTRLVDALEELDDVQEVYTNCELED